MDQKSTLALFLGLAPLVAHAQIFMAEDQAASVIFPGQTFVKKNRLLTEKQAAEIEKMSGESVRDRTLQIYETPSGDWVFIDHVLGKHEWIKVAVGVQASGVVRGIEVLEYRETYGSQVKERSWTRQFLGKKASDPIKLGQDIKNVSGATLSSLHLTNGVRRLVATYAVAH